MSAGMAHIINDAGPAGISDTAVDANACIYLKVKNDPPGVWDCWLTTLLKAGLRSGCDMPWHRAAILCKSV